MYKHSLHILTSSYQHHQISLESYNSHNIPKLTNNYSLHTISYINFTQRLSIHDYP
ncbi:hypothetical protein HanLR1_Chr13g0504681 [Helianthus annuus]|nr:hypothetical protein HanLR1_Chr13g0504681 [Helianthus annuus]